MLRALLVSLQTLEVQCNGSRTSLISTYSPVEVVELEPMAKQCQGKVSGESCSKIVLTTFPQTNAEANFDDISRT
jgi:hypothetical protein